MTLFNYEFFILLLLYGVNLMNCDTKIPEETTKSGFLFTTVANSTVKSEEKYVTPKESGKILEGNAITPDESATTLNYKKYYDPNQAREMFSEFIRKFKRKYENEVEFENRFRIFKENLEYLNELNKKASSTTFGITQFMDWSKNETLKRYGLRFEKHFKKLKSSYDSRRLMRNAPPHWDWRDHNADLEPLDQVHLPLTWDWRQFNVDTVPEDQGRGCRACWAFASKSIVESQFAIKYKRLIRLSVQQFLDCSGWLNNCIGGWPDEALAKQAELVGGVVPEEKYYPYRAEKGRCWVNRNNVVARIARSSVLNITDRDILRQHIYNFGPVASAVTWTPAFSMYTRGIAHSNDLFCSDDMHITHAVVIVGYGVESGVPYWIIKNSEGPQWGDGGYMYLHMGGTACKIMDYLVEVTVL